MEQCLLSEQLSAGVTQLTVNRPDSLNALSVEVIRKLYVECEVIRDQYYQAKKDGQFNQDTPRVLVLAGAGEKAFVAGADIGALSSEHAVEFLKLGVSLMTLLESLPIPVLAAVDGFCLGGGMELALASDLIIATERSKFGLPEISLGLIPGFGGTQRLPRRIGIGEARRLILTGEMLQVDEARRLGLIDIQTTGDKFAETILSTAISLTKRSPLAVEAAKSALKAADTLSKQEGLAEEERLFLSLIRTDDAKEGLSAFLQRRKPTFTGR